MDQLRYALHGINRRVSNLATKVRSLGQDLIKVNAKTQRAGATVEGVTIGFTEVTITWPEPWPDTLYGAYPTLIVGNAALANLRCTVKPGSKTTTQCVIVVQALALIASVGVDVLGVRT